MTGCLTTVKNRCFIVCKECLSTVKCQATHPQSCDHFECQAIGLPLQFSSVSRSYMTTISYFFAIFSQNNPSREWVHTYDYGFT